MLEQEKLSTHFTEILSKDFKSLSSEEMKQYLCAAAAIKTDKLEIRGDIDSVLRFLLSISYNISHYFDFKFNDDEIMYYLVKFIRSSVSIYLNFDFWEGISAWTHGTIPSEEVIVPQGLKFKENNLKPLKLIHFARKLFQAPYYNTKEIICWVLDASLKEFRNKNKPGFSFLQNDYYAAKIKPESIVSDILSFDRSLAFKPTYNNQSINFLCVGSVCNFIGKGFESPIYDNFYFTKLIQSRASNQILLISACYACGNPITTNKLLKGATVESIIICALKNGINLRPKDIIDTTPSVKLALLFSMSTKLEKFDEEIFQLINTNSPEIEQYIPIIANFKRDIPDSIEEIIKWADKGNIPALIQASKLKNSWNLMSNPFSQTIVKSMNHESSPTDDITVSTAIKLLNGGSSVNVFNKSFDFIISKTKCDDFCFIEPIKLNKTKKTIKIEDILDIKDNEVCVACICAILCSNSLKTEEELKKLAEISLISSIPLQVSDYIDCEKISGLIDICWKKSLKEALKDVRNFANLLNPEYKTTASEAISILIEENRCSKVISSLKYVVIIF
ncbi:hypothetical protein TVAG_014900 [Trichomonas vaginalis G3]|uniref:Uncharacterized protein n=1 Tax=Trichomonas vaginalis (strain ATCC PRA-98 / G3) TaxID=412133 RepID=A2FG59_TRIV3|nr:hypothetical protein TVAG_014900 [Trichomonas vaginalis G3]|eukprot:XP_001309028.1 hypothetical protein [Trichomonas vaginalis G3]